MAILSWASCLRHNDDYHPLRQDRLFAARPAGDRGRRAGSQSQETPWARSGVAAIEVQIINRVIMFFIYFSIFIFNTSLILCEHLSPFQCKSPSCLNSASCCLTCVRDSKKKKCNACCAAMEKQIHPRQPRENFHPPF